MINLQIPAPGTPPSYALPSYQSQKTYGLQAVPPPPVAAEPIFDVAVKS